VKWNFYRFLIFYQLKIKWIFTGKFTSFLPVKNG